MQAGEPSRKSGSPEQAARNVSRPISSWSPAAALSSALLLLRSANDRHPNGLANGSGQVGRNYMRHNQSILMALLREPNDTVFQKTLAVSDSTSAPDDWDFPLGLIQMCATSHGEQIRGEALPGWLGWLPEMPFEEMARHSMDFWLSSEDLPRPENRIFYDGDRVVLDVTEGNMEAHHRLKKSSKDDLSKAGAHPVCWSAASISARISRSAAPRIRPAPAASAPIRRPRCSTWIARRTRLDNLYVTDASFFPSIGAVNPTLTIIANALRVAEHLRGRLAHDFPCSGRHRRTLSARRAVLSVLCIRQDHQLQGAVGQAQHAVASKGAATILILIGLGVEILIRWHPFRCRGPARGVHSGRLLRRHRVAVEAILAARRFLACRNQQGPRPVLGFPKNFSLAGGFLLITFGTTQRTVERFFHDPLSSTHPYSQAEAP